MALAPGTRLGPYEVTAQIGIGGMGEVYQATDRNLKRQVAMKVLPDSVAGHTDRLARFRREAELLASLNHPNIAAIYGLEGTEGRTALVMELVEGPTLAARIAQGSIPVEEGLSIAKQIAEALEAAHGQGIVHRDLKPANIKVRSDGMVKVLDFGLAKAMEPLGASAPPDVSQMLTMTTPAMTQAGIILGTAAYMSPEQARGRPVDKRTDIWAFGCVLYEVLTGICIYRRHTVADTLSAVLSEAVDWNALPQQVPPGVRRVLARCLNKDLGHRLRDVGDARIELEEELLALRSAGGGSSINVASSAVGATTPPPVRRVRPLALAGIAAVLVLAGASGFYVWRQPGSQAARVIPVRFSIPPTADAVFGEFLAEPYPAVSPDGRYLAFVASSDGAPDQLRVRALESFDSTRIAGAIDVQWPFWSPDGRWVAYSSAGRLMKSDREGGPAQKLCDAMALGGTWGPSGVILFGSDTGIQRVSPDGGTPSPVMQLPAEQRITSQRFPVFLPDGQRFLFLQVSEQEEHSGIYVGSLDGAPPQRLLADRSSVAFSPGHLILVRGNSLIAQPVDDETLALAGNPVVLASPMDILGTVNYGPFSVAGDTLVYRTAANPTTVLSLVDRAGVEQRRVGPPGFYLSPALSPDGSQVVVSRLDTNTEALNLWQFDLTLGAEVRLTSGDWFDAQPVWSPDGRRLAYASTRAGTFDIYEKNLSGSGPDMKLHSTGARSFPHDWTRDNALTYTEEDGPGPEGDIWILRLDGSAAKPLFRTDADETQGRVSPDGRWIAFASDESGRWEIYVRSLDARGIRRLASLRGGTNPLWRADSREIYYLEPQEDTRTSLAIDQTLMAIAVRGGDDIRLSTPLTLFRVRTPTFSMFETWAFSASRDGQTFLIDRVLDATESPLKVDVGWSGRLP